MAELLISAVSGGDQGAFGTAGVTNAAQGVLSASLGETLGSGTSVVTFELPARSLALEFTQTVDPLPGTSVRFTFGGALIQPAVTAGAQGSFGMLEISNAAQGATAEGIEPPELRLPLVYPAVPWIPADLELGSVLPGYPAQNVPFTFGGALLVNGVTLGDLTAFGDIEDIEQVLSAAPSGIAAGSVGLPIATDAARNGSYIPLDVSQPSGGTDARALRLDFDLNRPVTQATVGLSAEFGAADIANAAQGAFAEGVAPGQPGIPLTYSKAVRDGFVELAFSQSVRTWPAENVPFYFNDAFALGPVGFEDSLFGATTASNTIEYLVPEGIAPTGVGIPAADNLLNTITPVWIEQTTFGAPSLTNTAAAVFVGGIAPPPQTGPNNQRQIPSPWTSYYTRYLAPGGVGAPSGQVPTKHTATHEIQFLDLAGRGIPPRAVGNLRIEFSIRYIEPTPVVSNVFGVANVARIHVAVPVGWESSLLSEGHELNINLQRVLVSTGGTDPADYGEAHIRNQYEVLSPTGWLSQDINFPVVFNLDQFVFVQPYMDTNSDPTQWSNFYPFVENKIRTLGPDGWQSSRFSLIGNLVENVAAPLQPPGLDATLWGPETFIAPRVRHVPAQGWDSLYSTRYAVVYNDAVVLAPSGWSNTQFGTPGQVANLNRTAEHIFPYGGETVGTAFIAYRVRSIYPNLFYDVPSGFPEVRFDPYPLAPVGIDVPQFGGHTVYEHFTTTHPSSANVHSVPWVGEPIIHNRNKTLAVFPSDQSLYGLAKVFNYNTHIALTAGELTGWGSPLIRDRTLTMTVAPISVPVFSVTHRAWNVIPDPPAQQLIETSNNSFGNIPAPKLELQWRMVYPEAANEEGYGSPVLTRTTLEAPPGIFNLDQVGIPILSTTQYLSLGGVAPGLKLPKPRVTPHTIYAPAGTEATPQARTNHSFSGQRIDEFLRSLYGSAWPTFGKPGVTNQNRAIGPVPRHSSPPGNLDPDTRYGRPTLDLRRKYVYPTPIRSQRFGLGMIPFSLQHVSLDTWNTGIPPFNAFGPHTVAPPFVATTPKVTPAGFLALRWGEHHAELFNRTVSPQGIPHRGNPQQGLTNPWGTPLIGYPRVYTLGGYVLTLWGDAWVSHKNRELPVEGWDSQSLGDEYLGSFADRIRVHRRNPEGSLPGIGPDSVIGDQTISHAVRTLFGRGISGYNSGDHIVKAVTAVLPAGWDSLEVGDIDRWEAGKVKPHGDDLSMLGTPRMRRPLRPPGPFNGVVGSPRVGVPIRPTGMPEIGFAGPSVSNPSGCTNRVITPLPILTQQNVPQPMVS